MDVLIRIQGKQYLDADSDAVELTTDGQLEQTGDGYRIRYQETALTGMEGTVTTLDITEGRVLLARSGTMNCLLVLEPEKRHEGSYETPYGSLLLGAYTHELTNNLTERGGDLSFRYTVDMNGSVTGHHELHISLEPTRGE